MSYKDFINNTTLHGIRNIAEASKIRRVFWLACLVTFFGVYLATTITSVQSYFRYESVTSISTAYKSYQYFPAVTICNINMFQESRTRTEYPEVWDYYENFMLGMAQDYSLPTILHNISFYDYYMNSAPRIKDMFVSCSHKNTNINCTSFIDSQLTSHGLCYTFHSNSYINEHGPIQIHHYGLSNAIVFVLNTEKTEYFIPQTGAIGFLISIHDSSTSSDMDNNIVLASVGKETQISIKKSIVHRLPKPFSEMDCIDTSRQERQNYSQEACLRDCIHVKVYKEKCSCTLTGITVRKCSMYDLYNCVFAAMSEIDTGSSEVERCGCFPKCDESTYVTKVSTAEFPNKYVIKVTSVHNQWPYRNETYIKENYAQVMIYFDTLEETIFTQTKVTTKDKLLADFGGLLGLFLGASCVTLIEILEFAFLLCLEKMKAKTNKLKVKDENQNT